MGPAGPTAARASRRTPSPVRAGIRCHFSCSSRTGRLLCTARATTRADRLGVVWEGHRLATSDWVIVYRSTFAYVWSSQASTLRMGSTSTHCGVSGVVWRSAPLPKSCGWQEGGASGERRRLKASRGCCSSSNARAETIGSRKADVQLAAAHPQRSARSSEGILALQAGAAPPLVSARP
eukprot:scaffold1403_cov381-Prasinococcus_capsulatus_cf.AAC.3